MGLEWVQEQQWTYIDKGLFVLFINLRCKFCGLCRPFLLEIAATVHPDHAYCSTVIKLAIALVLIMTIFTAIYNGHKI